MKVRALPTCRKPVGDGANRTRSITFEYSGIGILSLGFGQSQRGIMGLLLGYEGNSSGEDRYSGIASHKKIILKTPCPGRNLPEDTCCFDLSGVTGVGQR